MNRNIRSHLDELSQFPIFSAGRPMKFGNKNRVVKRRPQTGPTNSGVENPGADSISGHVGI